MPKQTGQKDAFYASLKLYYDSFMKGEQWYSNSDFKINIQKLLPYLSRGAKDGPYLVKQSELTRYFGLVYYDYSTRIGRAHITDRGIRFYNAYLQNNIKLQIDIIMESILNDSFGRNNTAIESSESDVDAPKLFLKSILDLSSITRKDLAYLLFVTHDKQVNYNDALCEFRSSAKEKEINIPKLVSNKYSDVKFTVLLSELEVCKSSNGKAYRLSEYVLEKYKDKINKLSIYNKEPEIVYTLKDELDLSKEDILKEETIEDIAKTQVISAFCYNINSDKFKRQNNRIPVPYKTKYGIKYKTNPRISKTALQLVNFNCEHNPKSHTTFISKFGQQYMEAHHIIPMHAQKDFHINLDRIENITCICPICHSAIHLGNTAVRLEYLKKLYDLRIQRLKEVGLNISFGDLFTKYYK
jgi:predicted HNH restriction endonuclease